MSRTFSFIGILLALVVGMWFYAHQVQTIVPPPSKGGATGIDVIGVRNDLMSIANAEHSQFALDGKYVSLGELRDKGVINLPRDERKGYRYAVEVSDTSFRAVASYSGPPTPGIPQTIIVDQTMRLEEQ